MPVGCDPPSTPPPSSVPTNPGKSTKTP
jgi:hypothetical protein